MIFFCSGRDGWLKRSQPPQKPLASKKTQSPKGGEDGPQALGPVGRRVAGPLLTDELPHELAEKISLNAFERLMPPMNLEQQMADVFRAPASFQQNLQLLVQYGDLLLEWNGKLVALDE